MTKLLTANPNDQLAVGPTGHTFRIDKIGREDVTLTDIFTIDEVKTVTVRNFNRFFVIV